jgi:hypothetical protein
VVPIATGAPWQVIEFQIYANLTSNIPPDS